MKELWFLHVATQVNVIAALPVQSHAALIEDQAVCGAPVGRGDTSEARKGHTILSEGPALPVLALHMDLAQKPVWSSMSASLWYPLSAAFTRTRVLANSGKETCFTRCSNIELVEYDGRSDTESTAGLFLLV